METQKNRRWIYLIIITALLSLLSFHIIYPNNSSISESFFRDNPDFFYEKEGRNLLICRGDDYTDDLKKLALNPDHPFETKKSWIKDDQERSILTWRMSGKKYVIKRYNACSIAHWLKQLVKYSSSTALQSFYYSYLLDQIDIKSAKAVAIIEKRVGPFLSTSYQVMEHIKGTKGSDFFDEATLAELDYDRSIKETVKLARKLENANLVHSELKLNHIVYVDGSPYLLDLDCVECRSKGNLLRREQSGHDLNLLVEDFSEHHKSKAMQYSEDFGLKIID